MIVNMKLDLMPGDIIKLHPPHTTLLEYKVQEVREDGQLIVVERDHFTRRFDNPIRAISIQAMLESILRIERGVYHVDQETHEHEGDVVPNADDGKSNLPNGSGGATVANDIPSNQKTQPH